MRRSQAWDGLLELEAPARTIAPGADRGRPGAPLGGAAAAAHPLVAAEVRDKASAGEAPRQLAVADDGQRQEPLLQQQLRRLPHGALVVDRPRRAGHDLADGAATPAAP